MYAISLAVHYECEFHFPDIRADHHLLLFEVTQRVYKLQPIIPFDIYHPITCSRRYFIMGEVEYIIRDGFMMTKCRACPRFNPSRHLSTHQHKPNRIQHNEQYLQ